MATTADLFRAFDTKITLDEAARDTGLQRKTSATYDDWLVRDFLKYMIAHYTYSYPIPGTTRSIGTGYGWFLDAQESVKDADAACRYPPDDSMYLYYWRKVLGNDFGA